MTQFHKTEPIFVGRQDELKRFGEVLASPKGQAVLVVGPQGMGKTLLVNRMARMARKHPDLKCGTVRYEVTKTDDVAGTMALMIDHAFEAANVGEKLLSGTGDQWRALFKAIGFVPVVGKAAEAIGELALSLKRDPAKDTRTQFIERLRFIAARLSQVGSGPRVAALPLVHQRCCVMAEVLPKGPNVRFVVTNLADDPRTIYDERYTARGDMENRIKEQQLGLFADRTSCHRFLANQFRLLLASAAYVLAEHLRNVGLKGTELAKAQVTTIRTKLFKIAARVTVSVRRIVFHLSSHCPYQQLFARLVCRFTPI